MAFLISGNLAIDETSGTQNAADTNDSTGNDVAGGLSTLSAAVPQFDLLLAAVVTAGQVPTGVSVSNATADNSTGSSLLTNLGAGLTDLAFTDADGHPLDGDVAKFGAGTEDYLRTADGSKIYLYSYTGADLAGVDENNVVFGRKANLDGSANASGDIVFAAYLQPTGTGDAALDADAGALGAKVWLVEYEAIQHGTTGSSAAAHDDARILADPLYVTVSNQSDFSLEGAPSGQNLFLMYGDGTPSADDATIVVTGKNPANQSAGYSITTGDTVNTGQGGGGTTIGSNNQMIDPSEGMYFTFVKGANTDYTVPNLSQTEADVEANIQFTSMYDATAATFSVVQLQPPKEATLKLTAYTTAKESGTAFIDGLHDDAMGDIDYVKVTTFARVGKTLVPTENVFVDAGTETISLNGIDVTFNANGSVTIAGVKTNNTIEYHTEGTHNRVLVDNVGGDSHHGSSFDIGGFALVHSSTDTDAFAALAFQDDGPSVTVSATNEDSVVMTTQDAQTDGDPTASDSAVTTADFSGVFGNAPVYGADGDGGTVMSYALSLYGAEGTDSLLDSNGASILLYKVGDVITGSTAASAAGITDGNTIFSIAVDAATGVVTLTQYAEIDHSVESETGSPFDDQLATLAAGLVKLTGTADTTDGDGDTASNSQVVDLGGNVRFADDGPSVTVSATNEASVVLTTQDAQTDGDPTASDSDVTTADFSGVFSNTPVYGADGAGTTVMSYALDLYGTDGGDSGLDSNGASINLFDVSGTIVGSTASALADVGEANTIFSIAVDADTGVVTLTQDAEIDHAAESETGSPFDDQLAVLGAGLVKLTGTADTTDGDGDTASNSQVVDLGGNVRFADDGPSVTVSATNEASVVLTTQDAQTDGDPTASDSDVTTADFSGVFSNTPVYGADGAGTTVMSYALDLYGTDGGDSGLDSNGASINLFDVSGTIVGSTASALADVGEANTIFSIAVDADTGVVTLTQDAEIDHAAESETGSPFDDQLATLATGLVKLTGTADTTDGDGDTASNSQVVDLGGNVRFADDGPSVTVSATGEEDVLLTTYDAKTDGDPTASDSAVTTADFSGVFGNAPVYGADGDGGTVMSYALSLYGAEGTDSLLDSNGASILLYKVGDVITGSTAASAAGITDGNTIFSIAVDAATGVVTLTQNAEIDHAAESETGSPFDDQLATLATGLVKLTGTADTTDGDGDTASNSQVVDLGGNVRFADDGPSVTVSATNEASVVLTTQDAQTDGDPTASDSDVTTADFSGVFSNTPVYGADGAGTTVMSYALDLYGTDGGDSGLDSNGASINLFDVSGTIVGSTASALDDVAAANTIFSIGVVAATGVVTLTQYAEIDHSVEIETGSPFDDQLATLAAGLVKLTGTADTTDGDGDTATHSQVVDLGGNVRFADDGPSVTVSATGEEDVLLTTYDAKTDGDPTASDSAVTTADFSGVFSNTPVYGADGAGTTVMSYALDLYGTDGGDSGLDSNGASINLFDVSGTIVGSTASNLDDVAAANTIFSIAVDADTGVVTLTQDAEIDHSVEIETGSPFDDQLATLAAGLVKLTGTADTTDGDGDTASNSQVVDLGGNVRFADDGPSVTVSATNEASVVLTTQDAQTDGDPTASDSAVTTADFSGVFSNTPVYGADGAGTSVMSYELALYGTDGGDSGLDSNGASINLFDVSGTIVGSTASALDDVAAANTIFSIGVVAATGVVTLTQYAEIDHSVEIETGSPFDDQLATLAAGLVKLTGTADTTDGDGDTATHSQVVDLGGNVRFADDGPTLSGVDDSTNSIVFGLPVSPATWSAHDEFAFAAGADGLGGMALVGFTDPDDAADLAASGLDHLEELLGVDITATQVGNTVTYYTPDGGDADTNPDALFSFAVTDSDWTFTILQDAPLVFNDFNFGSLAAGGPQEILSLAATNSTTFGVFDGFLFGDIDAADGEDARGINPPTPINLPGSTTADTADDLNPDAHGFGVKGGAASNINNNEGFSVSFHAGSATGDDATVQGLRFAMDAQGNTDDVVMSFQLTDSGTMPDIVAIEEGSTINLIASKDVEGIVDDGSFWVRMGLPGGNNDVFFTILSNEYKDAYAPQANELVVYVDGTFETAMFRMAYPDKDTYDQYPNQVGDSVRVKDVTLIETLPIPNVALEFSLQGTDGDGDTTQVEIVGVMISEDGTPFV